MLNLLKKCIKRTHKIFSEFWSIIHCNRFLKTNDLIDANSIFTHLTCEEKKMLFELASQKKMGVFVEIGSYLGASTSFIAAAIDDDKAKLFCVDTWNNETMPDGEKDTYQSFIINIEKFRQKITPLRGKSTNVAKAFTEKVDFLFIDGDHSYNAVKADVVSWLPKLKSDAIIIFHDIGWAEGVQKVIQEDVSPKVIAEGRLPNMYWAWL